MSKGFASSYRMTIVAVLALCVFGSLEYRLYSLHVLKRNHYLSYVEHVRHEIIPTYSRRGDIRDINGALLATSMSVVEVGVDPSVLRDKEESKWPQLAELLGMPFEELKTILTTKYREASVTGVKNPQGLVFHLESNQPKVEKEKTEITQDIAGVTIPKIENPAAQADNDDSTVMDEADNTGKRLIRYARLSKGIDQARYAEIEKLKIHGVYGTNVYRRAYPHNELASHLIGYLNHQEVPLTGIEHYANFFLRGQDGWVETEKDGKQRELAQFRTREVPAADGYSVDLSIDSAIQHLAEAELQEIRDKYSPQKATIIISDPRTGFILAMANYPTFNLNEFNKLPASELSKMRNVAVSDLYEPGSVFKIIAASAALDDGLVNPNTTFDCTLKEIEYKGKIKPLPAEDKSDHFDRPLTVSEIIAHSSNKGAVQLAMKLGEQRFYDYMHSFGIGLPTGFPVGNEPDARTFRIFVPPPKYWDGLTFTRIPMGQSVAATALQMHQAMGVIASGGVLLKPQIIKRIRDSNGDIVYRFDRVEERRVIKASTAKTMARMLLGVTSGSDSTGFRAAIPGYEVGGKTGTTQKLVPMQMASGKSKLVYSKTHHVSSFVGFFPATDPQVEISVIVDDADARTPGKIGYGGLVAAPSFKHLGEQLIPYMAIRAPSVLGAAGRSMVVTQGGNP